MCSAFDPKNRRITFRCAHRTVQCVWTRGSFVYCPAVLSYLFVLAKWFIRE